MIWAQEGSFKLKPCDVCGKKFKPRSGAGRYCSKKCLDTSRKTRGAGKTEEQYRTISGNFWRYFCRLAAHKKRPELTAKDLMEKLEEQRGLCAISGVPLTCFLQRGKRFDTNASVDRISAGGSYEKDNVQLVCAALNKWRGDTPVEKFIEWCRKVVNMADKNRDYRAEYDAYHAKPEQKKRRAARNRARAEAMDRGAVRKGDGKEVHHVGAPRKGSLDRVPTRVVSRKTNRSIQPKRK